MNRSLQTLRSGLLLVMTGCLTLTVLSTVGAENPSDKSTLEKAALRSSVKVGTSAAARSATSVSRSAVREISDRIDELVLDKLESNDLSRNPKINDAVFVRRIYLDIAGRIPTLDETTSFLQSKSKNRRAALIDDLLDSYGHVSRQYNYWADVLRVQSRSNKLIGAPYIDFLKDSIESNLPYDEFVRELLTAHGKMLGADSGAVGYYLRDLNMPEDNMSNTVRVFLGTRLECAQCHDHPFDQWTQRDYFEMVAFTGGLNYGNGYGGKSLTSEERKQMNELKNDSKEDYQKVRRMLGITEMGVFGTGTGLARLPEGFMGDDGEENEVVVAKTMFEKKPLVDAKLPSSINARSKNRKKKKNKRQQFIPGARPIDSRLAYAQWMTSPENPRFAMNIANRLWKQALGLGIIEPVDVIEDITEPSNEPLMEYLTEVMVDLNFDTKQFLRAIYNSRTYQSLATAEDINDPQTHSFNGPIVRRMSAEQIWDSLLVLTIPDVDQRSDSAEINRGRGRYNAALAEIANSDSPKLEALISFVRKDGSSKKMMSMKASQRANAKEIQRAIKTLNKQINTARRAKDNQLVKELTLQRVDKIQSLKSKKNDQLRRASELASPAPAGHFLRQFGQSDRDQIENANTDPAVTQVLAMMNGMIEKQIVKDRNTVLMSNLLKNHDPDHKESQAISTLFLTMLNREPTRKEQRQWQNDFRSDFQTGYGDLIWTLANSNEFIFIK